MSGRLKILACGYINRGYMTRKDDYILTEAQVNVLDIATKEIYNVFCESIFIGQDQYAYRIKVCGWCSDDVIDECIIDSSGGIITGDSFSCDNFDEQFGDEILELVIKYLIVEF